MLAQINNSFRRHGRCVLLLCSASALISCATKQPQPLVSDPSIAGHESALPWNEQQKWEREGQFAGGFSQEGQGRH